MRYAVRVLFPSVAILLAFLGRSECWAGELTAVLLPVADTGLYEIAPTNNLGRSLAVPAGVHSGLKRSRYLVRFDLADELPAGAVVTGVALRVQVAVAGSPVHEYGVQRMLHGWVEGNKQGNNGSGATAGETTWLAQSHPDGTWTAPGGAGGVDYVASPSATASLGDTGSTNYFTSEELAADVQHWVDSPELNFGWMMRAVDESVSQTVRRIASRESATGSPLLLVSYRPADSDDDGVPDPEDQCPGTTPGAVVNTAGCSLEQLVPYNAPWKNHGHYVAAVAAAADEFVRAGLLTDQQRAEKVREAARSTGQWP